MITDQLVAVLRAAVESARAAGDLTLPGDDYEVTVGPPKSRQFGDFTSNVALTLARAACLPSREVASIITKHVPADAGMLSRVEVAGPGFLNLYLRPTWLQDVLVEVEADDEAYGNNSAHTGDRFLIEFVSANPTGPISVVNGRAAALGDSLRRLLSACGAEVHTEFYVNDALNSTQLNLMGASLAARFAQQLGRDEPLPDDGYQGEYLVEMAAQLVAEQGAELDALEGEERILRFRQIARSRMVSRQEEDLAAFGVRFDEWYYESRLYAEGLVHQAIQEMQSRGYAYEKDGALWLRSTVLSNDDQDRVLVRSNERETYVAADAAYHAGKFRRGYTRLIDIWGADHHGYVSRLKAGIAALGYDPDACEIILTQMVMLMRDGEPVRGSKRAGDIIPLSDLVEEIGADAARFYFLLNSYETTATFDLEVAKRQSSDNPVFYAQYAHARCCSLLAKADELGIALRPAGTVDRSLLVHPRELELLRTLADFPQEVRSAADMRAPHRLAAYVRVIGQALHQFYEECPVLKEEVPDDLKAARLAVINSTRLVVRNLLALIGVSAPARM